MQWLLGEICGIYEGMALTIRLGMMKVELSTDSQAITKLLKTGKIINNDGISLVNGIFHLMRDHEKVKVVHTYRETNMCVNVLAKIDLCTHGGIMFFDSTPAQIECLLEANGLGVLPKIGPLVVLFFS